MTTHVWQHFMEEATKGWAINPFTPAGSLERAAVDPWTGLLPRAAARRWTSCS